MAVEEKLPKPVEHLFSDVYDLVHDKEFSFEKHTSKQRYIGLVSAHLSTWGIPPDMAAELAEAVLNMHSKIVDKVGNYLRRTYGPHYEDYAHDFIKNALVKIYGDANAGLLEDFARHPERRNAYLRVVKGVAKAVQSNPAITDHVIRESMIVAPYAAMVHKYPLLTQLIHRALERRYPRVLTDVRHAIEAAFGAEHTSHYLDAMEDTLRKVVSVNNPKGGGIPRHHLHLYASAIIPIAAHAALIDSAFSGSDVRATHELARFLYGTKGAYYARNLLSLVRDYELNPLLLGIAKHWNGGMNDRLLDAFHMYMEQGPSAMRELVETDGKVAWGSLWDHISRSVVLEKKKDGSSVIVSMGKKDPLMQLRAICQQPTCLYPANPQGQRYGVDYALNTKKGEVMPVYAVAQRVRTHRGAPKKPEIVGRILMFVDPTRGNVHIASTPVGSEPLDTYIELAKKYAQEVNKSAGKKIIERIIVGGRGKMKFILPVDDAYGDMIVKKGDRHYIRDAQVIPVD